jgi:thioredoxin-like negative regulator of GroEL
MSDTVVEIQSSQFNSEVRSAPMPVVLDFFSTECPPCEALASKFEAVAEQFKGRVRFLKIYRQGNRDLATQLAVSSSPTLLFFKGGKEVGTRMMGDIKRSELKQAVETMLG